MQPFRAQVFNDVDGLFFGGCVGHDDHMQVRVPAIFAVGDFYGFSEATRKMQFV